MGYTLLPVLGWRLGDMTDETWERERGLRDAVGCLLCDCDGVDSDALGGLDAVEDLMQVGS